MSFNPTLGLLYVSGQSGGGFTYAVKPDFEYDPKGQNMGIVFGRGPGGPPPGGAGAGPGAAGGRGGPGANGGAGGAGATPGGENVSPEVAAARAAAAAAAATAPAPSTAPAAPAARAAKQRPALKSIGPDTNGGFLVAYDPATGTERWRVPGGSAIGGGTVATGGGIVFQATGGTLYAYSADKGEKLLELKTGVPGGMAPPITFMLDGKQYVALQVGQGRPGPGPGGNAPPPNPNAPPPVNPRLLVYALDGTAKLP